MSEQIWYKVVVELKQIDLALIEQITDLLFEWQSIGTQVEYADGFLENSEAHFGEIYDDTVNSDVNVTSVIAYFEQEQDLDALQVAIIAHTQFCEFQLLQSIQQDYDWQKEWMVHYQPEAITRFLTVVPIWQQDYQRKAHESVIFLDPGVAFGTGNHPTTQLGAQALEIAMRGGETVLDVGTGSGILAFVAKVFGASQVYGYDLDPQAVESAKLNLTYQEAQDNIAFSVNNLLVDVDVKADIIVANILPHIIVEMLDDAKRCLNEHGWLILGGILQTKSAELEAELKRRNWRLVQKMALGEWCSLMLQCEERE